MTTATKTAVKDTNLISIAFVAFMGLSVLFIAGFANAAHDSAHDTRHTIGFACH